MRKLILLISGLMSASAAEAAVRSLGTLGGNYSFARDINSEGLVVGESKTSSGETHAFLFEGNELIDLGTLPGQTFSMANGVNNLGQATGYGRDSVNSGMASAIVWNRDESRIILPNLPREQYSQGSDLNDHGDVAGVSGTRAVLWTNHQAKELKGLEGDYSIALGINNHRSVVGNSLNKAGDVRATLWKVGENRPVDLGTLGGRFSTANAINDENQIVGSSETAEGAVHAFIWEDGDMIDLGPGMIRRISEKGRRILGESPHADSSFAYQFADGESHFQERLPETLYSSIFAGNESGSAVGVSELKNKNSSVFHATIWFEGQRDQ